MVTARGVLSAAATATGPFCLAGAITAIAMAWPAPAGADTGSGLLSDFGIGNNGPVSTAVGQLASGFCPFLGESNSNGQVTAQIAAGAEPTIDPECAAFMMSIANGDLTALVKAPSVFGQSPSAATPLSTSGVAASDPTAVPGL